MRNVAVHLLCPCGQAAAWRKTPPRPEDAPEYAVCLLTDDDFADDYCDECFQSQVTLTERPLWKRINRQEKLFMPDDIHKVETAGTVEDELGDTDYTNGSEEAPGQDSPGSVPDDASGSSGAAGQGRT
ncbi:MAG: hypothetical protein M3Y28_06090 [Armatimonadota bacterium]|nr:hypothetical protein [Armatimonadota bacterium]